MAATPVSPIQSSAHEILALLQRRLKEIQLSRKAFSLRALAKRLKLSPAHLSLLFSGKKPLTLECADRILDYLELPAEQSRSLRMRLAADRQSIEQRRVDRKKLREFLALTESEFELIANWFYFPLLALLETRDAKSEPAWLARRLGIETKQVVDALERLETLRLVERKGTRWIASDQKLSTTYDIPSAAIRNYHREGLKRATEALEGTPIDRREFGTTVLALNASEVEAVRKFVREQRRKMAAKIQRQSERNPQGTDEVYHLSVLLYPVTRRER